MLHVIYINITKIDSEVYQRFRSMVSEGRRDIADRFHFAEDSIRSVCAELLLQYSLYQEGGRLIDLDISYNEYGKPYINHRDGFFYNVTHSGSWVALAYADAEVGIDIEKIQYRKDNIADRFFTDVERNYIHAAPKEEQAKRFTLIWTLKESYVKYMGTGLSTSLNSFTVHADEGRVSNQNGEFEQEIRFESALFDSGYYLSVCSKEREMKRKEVSPEQILECLAPIDEISESKFLF